MKETMTGYIPDFQEANEEKNTPKDGDFALIDLRGKTALVYLSDEGDADRLPDDVAYLRDSCRGDFNVVFKYYGADKKSETTLYKAIASLCPGETTTYKIRSHQETHTKEVSLYDFWSYEEKDIAISELNKKLDIDDGKLYIPR